MNTSAFVTSIRIKIEENQFKTYFFLFAFCLIIASFSIEKIIGNLISEKLELERKKDFKIGIEASFEERWKLHMGQIRSYAYWPEVWDLIKAKKMDKAYLQFQLDPSIDKQFDFFAVYLEPENEFILKWSHGSGEKKLPERKIISQLYSARNQKEGQANHILYFNQKYYLVSVTCLADNVGKPMINGIMLFAYELDNFIVNASDLFPLRIEIIEEEELPLNIYDSISLDKLTLPGSSKVTLVYTPITLRINVIRPYIIGMLAILSITSLIIFSWIFYKIQNPSLD